MALHGLLHTLQLGEMLAQTTVKIMLLINIPWSKLREKDSHNINITGIFSELDDKLSLLVPWTWLLGFWCSWSLEYDFWRKKNPSFWISPTWVLSLLVSSLSLQAFATIKGHLIELSSSLDLDSIRFVTAEENEGFLFGMSKDCWVSFEECLSLALSFRWIFMYVLPVLVH